MDKICNFKKEDIDKRKSYMKSGKSTHRQKNYLTVDAVVPISAQKLVLGVSLILLKERLWILKKILCK